MKLMNWTKKFYTLSGNGIAKNLSLLLNKKVAFSEVEYSEVPFDQLNTTLPQSIVTSKIFITQDLQAEACFFSSKHDAIVMGCMLMMYSDATVEAKLAASSFDSTELDAFREICSQLISSVDRALTESVPQKLHLKLGDTQVVDNEAASQDAVKPYFVSGNVVQFSYRLKLEKKREVTCHILFPVALITQFDDEANAVAAQTTQSEMNENASEAGQGKGSTKVLLIQLNETRDSCLPELFSEKKIPFCYVNTFSQLQEQVSQSPVKLVVIQTGDRVKNAIDLCQKLAVVFHQKSVPIWLQGRDWNQDLIMKAVQCGASYLIASPLSRDLIEQRVSQILP